MRISCENNDENVLNKLHKFWDLDSIGIKENESSVYEKFEEEIEFIDNRYVVKLPVKENHPPLPDNYLLSKKRLEHLKSKLEKDESLLKRYDDVIQEQLKMGIIEEINTPGVPNNVTYLPHRAVIKENRATTKLRIVFAASAKSNKDNVSLYEILYKGPCMLPALYNLLLKFRMKPIAITADIEKAYLQIRVNECHRDLLRFLWYKNLFSTEPTKMQRYRFTRFFIYKQLLFLIRT